tara:strand:- start:18689 stop:19009 length:321 start_codon:yes stop_codon:yes gene_type:complete
MRTQEAKRQVRLAIKKSLRDGKTIHISNAKKAIKQCLDYCWKEQECDRYMELYDIEPYSYSNDQESEFAPSINELSYISDRFMAQHRIEWLYGIANSDHLFFDDAE